MKKTRLLTLILAGSLLYSCNSQNEVLLNDCNAFGGKIRYNNELYTGKVKDIRNGVLKSEFSVVDGEHDGDKTNYYADGKTKSSVSKYNNGKIVETIYYDENGKETGRN
jgi:major membrane immunogen (membrane-anchored lipoprotein)